MISDTLKEEYRERIYTYLLTKQASLNITVLLMVKVLKIPKSSVGIVLRELIEDEDVVRINYTEKLNGNTVHKYKYRVI